MMAVHIHKDTYKAYTKRCSCLKENGESCDIFDRFYNYHYFPEDLEFTEVSPKSCDNDYYYILNEEAFEFFEKLIKITDKSFLGYTDQEAPNLTSEQKIDIMSKTQKYYKDFKASEPKEGWQPDGSYYWKLS